MPLTVNLRHLAEHAVVLKGDLQPAELAIDTHDEMIEISDPCRYSVEIQRLDESLLIQGQLQLDLTCQCVRCLKRFKMPLKINPWVSHLPLQGEEAIPVSNDCVDLTPVVREDILLEFPQHPLCKPDCRGLDKKPSSQARSSKKADPTPSAWNTLDKLKL